MTSIEFFQHSYSSVCHHNDKGAVLKNSFQHSFCIGNRLLKNRVQSGDNWFLNPSQKLNDVLAPFSAEYTIFMLQIHNIDIRRIDVLSDLLVGLNVICIDLRLHPNLIVIEPPSIVDRNNHWGRHRSCAKRGGGIHEMFGVRSYATLARGICAHIRDSYLMEFMSLYCFKRTTAFHHIVTVGDLQQSSFCGKA